MVHVLIAEDDPDVANVVGFGVRMAWPAGRATVAADGADAMTKFEADPPDLVVLDVSIPPPDGFDVLRRIRGVSQVPVLMLTARDATIDKVRAFDFGADDYLTKPFDHLELQARLRALARRSLGGMVTGSEGFVCGDLAVDFSTQQVRVGEEIVRLTSTEYRLLEVLARNAGTVLPHELLLERVWGSAWKTDPSYLKVFVRRIRHKLGDDADAPRYIFTEWGRGYRLGPAR